MKQTSEIEEIRAALKRAAYKAVHGTREERSGRFLRAESKQSEENRPEGAAAQPAERLPKSSS
jgi:hypothetical protein